MELSQRLSKVLGFKFKNNILQWSLIKTNNERFEFYQTQIKSFCVVSGRSRGVFKLFKVSRIKLRELSGKSCFFGLKKAS